MDQNLPIINLIKTGIKHIFNINKYTNYQIEIDTTTDNILDLSILEDPGFGKVNVSNSQKFKFDYYNGELEKITIECESTKAYTIAIEEHDLRIKQIYMNSIFKIAFLEGILKAHNLIEYHDNNAPAIFYGLTTPDDLLVFEKHKSLKIVIWMGGDINYRIKRTKMDTQRRLRMIHRIASTPKVKLISASSFISRSMDELKLPYSIVPFLGIDFDLYKPIKKGPCIYLYTTLHSEDYYGSEIYTKLMEKYKHINFITTCCKYYYDNVLLKMSPPYKYNIKWYEKTELINEIYPQCFVGLRLTQHDGPAWTVQELGLLGIKSIHNGNSPSSLNYKTFDDVCNHIETEMKTIGSSDPELATKVREYLTIDDKFFNTSFFK